MAIEQRFVGFGIAAFALLPWPQEAPPRAAAASSASAVEVFPLGSHRALKVLYAGVPDTPRFAAFSAFLGAHFDGFAAQDVTKLDAVAAEPFDVVVCDGKRLYPMDAQNPSIDQAECKLGPDFRKPIVMLGAMGGSVQHHTKLDWL